MSESNSERLNAIRNRDAKFLDGTMLKNDFDWLLERAQYANDAEPVIKKVAKLNEYISRADVGGAGRLGESVTDVAIDELKRLNEENKRLHEALEGLGKAVEIYSGMSVDEALKEAIQVVLEDSE